MSAERIPEDYAAPADMTPPHDTHAEEAILGSVLKRPGAISALIDLPAADFYTPKYRAIWSAMLDLWRRNVGIDHATLDARLQAPDLAKANAGLVDLATINLSVPSASNVEHYARLVTDAATQRRYIDAAQSIAERAWPRGADIDGLVSMAESLLTAARPRQSRRDLYDPERWAEVFWDDLEGRATGQRTSVTTGLDAIDTMTLGLEAGGLYLLMATPGSGKTELAMQVGMHVAQKHGTVVFASLEMSAVELAQRFARISVGLDRNHLVKGTLDEAEHQSVQQVVELMRAGRLWPATPRGKYTVGDLRADALEAQARGGKVALIVADYVQRFRDGDGVPAHREINIGMVAENLKSLAREFECPVLAPVQPNREYVSRLNKRPLLSDLRESGKLEQEADVVLGLYRDEKHDSESSERGLAELHVLKNRSGAGDPDGMRRLVWIGTRYGDYTGRTVTSWAA